MLALRPTPGQPSRVIRGLRHLPDPAPVPSDPLHAAPRLPTLSTPQPTAFVRNPRARRYILRILPEGTVRITIPRGGSEAFARQFLKAKQDWVRLQRERLARLRVSDGPTIWEIGTPVWYRGERLPLLGADDDPRVLRLGDQCIPAPPGPIPEDWRPVVEEHLRRLAARELPALVLTAAATWDLPVQRVSIRNQRTRWGSCSRRGTISLNWHLVQTPTLVRDYLIAHELAHLREMNHSRRFWALVAEFFPAWRDAERWLKTRGRDVLHPRD